MSDTVTVVKTVTQLKEPDMYRVVFHNDDYTPMEFVIAILIQFFEKSEEESVVIAQHVHEKGRGIAGTYTHEVASQKVDDVTAVSNANKHPLRVTMEKA